MPIPRSALILVAGLVAMQTACDSDNGTGPTGADVAGNYTLVSVAGRTPPATVLQDAATRTDVVSGSLELTGDHAFTLRVALRLVVGAQSFDQPQTTTGSYRTSGNSLTLTETSSGQTTVLTVSGNELTGSYQSIPVVFRR